MSHTPEVLLINRMDDIIRRLDRIDQLLREIGPCSECNLAHRRGQIECEKPVELRAV